MSSRTPSLPSPAEPGEGLRDASARRALLTLLLALIASTARAQEVEVAAKATLDRPESPVVLTGERLAPLLGARASRVRALAVRGGRLVSIPLQTDERLADGAFALEGGDERRSDHDDGALDANDEVVLMGGDAGDRLPPAAIAALSSGDGPRWVEVELAASDGGRAWAYLGLAERDAPALAPDDRIRLDWQQGDLVGWTGRRARVGCSATCILDLRELRFTRADGAPGPDVLDRAKLSIALRYLFLDIARHLDEVRTRVVAWRDGPLRAVLRFQAETYLIWGHWVRSNTAHQPTRCQAVVWEDRVELELELHMPVALEADAPSELRFGLDLSPDAGAAALWTDRQRTAIRAGSTRAQQLHDVDRALPRWLVTTCAEGAFALRLAPGDDLARPTHGLSLLDGPAGEAPEDHAGSILSGGFALDLTGLRAQTYRARVVLQLGAPVQPGAEQPLLRVDDDPLTATVVVSPR